MAIFSLYNEIWEVSLLKYKINIIDDEKHLNDIVRIYLEKEGYECTSFYTYDEALMHCDDDVHLWLVDIMLDKNSGFDLLTAIKSKRPDMPIVLCLQETRTLTELLV